MGQVIEPKPGLASLASEFGFHNPRVVTRAVFLPSRENGDLQPYGKGNVSCQD